MIWEFTSARTEQGICTVTLHRNIKLNSLTPAMLEELGQHAKNIDNDDSIRAVILTAEGARAFCVGADINEWAALGPIDMWRRWVKRGHEIFDMWAHLRQPTIAAINGHAFGGGLELAITTDIRIAIHEAQFALPEASIGTCPGWSGTQRLCRLVGSSQAKYLALGGQRISAAQALSSGLVHEVVDAETLLLRASAIAHEIAKKAPISVQVTKQLINAASGEDRGAAIEAIAGGFSAMTQDAKEGVSAFKEKRQPKFSGY